MSLFDENEKDILNGLKEEEIVPKTSSQSDLRVYSNKGKKRYVSASQLILFLECPYKWYRTYKLHEKSEGSTATTMGTILHAAIESFFKFSISQDGLNIKNYRTRFHEIGDEKFEGVWADNLELLNSNLKDGEDVEVLKKHALEELHTYIDKFISEVEACIRYRKTLSAACKECKPKVSEHKIIVDDKLIMYIDQIFESEDKLIINDLKTSKYKQGAEPGKLWDDGYRSLHYEKHLIQGKVYLYGVYKETGRIADYLSFEYLKYGKVIQYPISKEYGKQVIKEIEDALNQLIEFTQSDNELDYPCNNQNNLKVLNVEMSLQNEWCSANGSKRAGKGWCMFEEVCNERIGE